MTDRQTLHFLTCGHVDDGKSTFIGRLLHGIGCVPDDQMQGAKVGDVIDFSRLTDGLEDERAQSITIDVAYRYFRYRGRHYRIADTPGHVQYTRNMAVAAANSDCALILVDATQGVREQTVRHSHIADFFGIRHFMIAVNKMDLADYSEKRFREIESAYRATLPAIANASSLTFMPVSALMADNIVDRSGNMPWYNGPALVDYLDGLKIAPPPAHGMRLPIQSVIRFGETRGYQGMLTGGPVALGEKLGIAGSKTTLAVTALYHGGRETDNALPGQAITLMTDSETDLGRGNVLYGLNAPMAGSETLKARLLWLDAASAEPEIVRCIIKINNREEQAEVHNIRRDDPVIEADIHTAAPLPADAYALHGQTGLFLLIEPESEKVIGVGTVVEG